ncbi:autoinducer binding domain-containing protein [Serratia sp. IR-2025]
MTVTFANAVAARLHLDGRLHAFRQFKYAYLTFNKHLPDRHLLVSSYPQEWLDIYSANRYQRIDPVVRAAHSRCAPFMWHDTPVTTEDRHYRKIFSQAREYDIVHGCSFVLHDHDNNLAILSISATAADDAELRQLMEDERASLPDGIGRYPPARSGLGQRRGKPDRPALAARRGNPLLGQPGQNLP